MTTREVIDFALGSDTLPIYDKLLSYITKMRPEPRSHAGPTFEGGFDVGCRRARGRVSSSSSAAKSNAGKAGGVLRRCDGYVSRKIAGRPLALFWPAAAFADRAGKGQDSRLFRLWMWRRRWPRG